MIKSYASVLFALGVVGCAGGQIDSLAPEQSDDETSAELATPRHIIDCTSAIQIDSYANTDRIAFDHVANNTWQDANFIAFSAELASNNLKAYRVVGSSLTVTPIFNQGPPITDIQAGRIAKLPSGYTNVLSTTTAYGNSVRVFDDGPINSNPPQTWWTFQTGAAPGYSVSPGVPQNTRIHLARSNGSFVAAVVRGPYLDTASNTYKAHFCLGPAVSGNTLLCQTNRVLTLPGITQMPNHAYVYWQTDAHLVYENSTQRLDDIASASPTLFRSSFFDVSGMTPDRDIAMATSGQFYSSSPTSPTGALNGTFAGISIPGPVTSPVIDVASLGLDTAGILALNPTGGITQRVLDRHPLHGTGYSAQVAGNLNLRANFFVDGNQIGFILDPQVLDLTAETTGVHAWVTRYVPPSSTTYASVGQVWFFNAVRDTAGTTRINLAACSTP